MDKEKNNGKKPVEKKEKPSIDGKKFREDIDIDDIIKIVNEEGKGSKGDNKEKNS